MSRRPVRLLAAALAAAFAATAHPALADAATGPVDAPVPVVVSYASADDAVPVADPSLGQRIAEKLQAKGFSTEAAITTISMLPIVELRGAIPVGHILMPRPDGAPRFGRDDLARSGKIFFWAVLGNMLPMPFILLLLGPLSRLAMRCRPGQRFFDWLFARTRKKTAGLEKYKFWGLAIFVAVPLPVTGAWTGVLAGWLMGIPFWKSLASLLIGVCCAGVIMTALSLLGWIGLAIALAALLLLVLIPLVRKGKPAQEA